MLRRDLIAIAGAGLVLAACAKPQDTEAGGESAAAEAEAVGAPTEKTRAPPAAMTLAGGLDDAFTLAVVAPPPGGSTYRVDAFVPALVAAAVARDGAAWFSAYRGTPSRVDYEVVGWQATAAAERVGFHHLGLREGDIIEEINGVPAADASAIEGALAGADRGVTIGLFREDYSFVMSYAFEPGLAWSRTLETYGGPPAAVDTPPDLEEPIAAAELLEPDEPLEPAEPLEPDEPAAPTSPAAGGSGTRVPTTKPAGGARPSVPKPTSPRPSKPKPSAGSSSVSCSTADKCTIRRAYFDSMTSSPTKLDSQATIVPAIRNDVFSGYKLKWVRPGSTVAQLGFRAGDKITHINGRDLTDDSEAFALYLGRTTTKVYKVRYVRGGKTATKTITVV